MYSHREEFIKIQTSPDAKGRILATREQAEESYDAVAGMPCAGCGAPFEGIGYFHPPKSMKYFIYSICGKCFSTNIDAIEQKMLSELVIH